jgi:thioredoxin 1
MSDPNVLDLNDTNFEQQVLQSPVPVLVDFTAVWCAPCRAISPHIDAIASSSVGRLRVGKLDVDENSATAARFDVRAMPTLLVFKNGQVVGQLVGAVPRARIEALVAGALAGAAA